MRKIPKLVYVCFFVCQNHSEVPKHVLQLWGSYQFEPLEMFSFFGKVAKTGVAEADVSRNDFWTSGMGTGMANSIPEFREREWK